MNYNVKYRHTVRSGLVQITRLLTMKTINWTLTLNLGWTMQSTTRRGGGGAEGLPQILLF